MRKLWKFLTSPLLCVLTGVGFALTGFALSLAMNWRGEFFREMDSHVLLSWVLEKLDGAFFGNLLFFFAFLAVVAIFVVNLVLCTAEKIYHLTRWKAKLRAYVPHLMHAAIVVVVAGHLVSSVGGYRARGVGMYVGTEVRLKGAPFSVRLDDVDVKLGRWGFPEKTSAVVRLRSGGATVAWGTISPNNPLSHNGYMVYLKSAGADGFGRRYAVLDVNKDDGAFIVLVGALIFTAGNLIYLLILPPLKPENFNSAGDGET